LVLEDPRLAPVKAQVDREAYVKAAQDLGAIVAASPALSTEDRRAWLYQLGRLRGMGGDPLGAAKAFQESAALGWALSDYAHLQAAQWLVGVGQFDAALSDVAAIGPNFAGAPAVDLVVADALLGKKDIEGASARFRAYLGREKRPAQWVTVTLRFALALRNYPSEAHAEEAIRLARRVIYESSGGVGVASAKDIEEQALSTLPQARRKAFEKPTSDELLARAKGLAASQQSREAVLVTDRLVRMPRAEKAGEFACDVWLTRADAVLKMKKKPEAADIYKDAIDHCAGQPRRVEALFWAGRASAQAERHLEAVARFAQLEKEFPTHRLADDARLRGAREAREAGDEAKYIQMLDRIASDYPQGDLATDGLFDLALHYIDKKDWAGAIAQLSRALARAPHERAYFAAGRLPYFLARAHIETGAVQQGMGELAGVIRDYPLSYYMALAFARMAERDRSAAERAVTDASAREPEGRFTLPRGAWAEDPAFLRAAELIRQGDAKLARGELDRLGVGARTAPAPVLWAAAFLLGRAGAATASHSLLRSGMATNTPQGTELVDWLDHYPVGRWRAAWEVAYPRPFAAMVAVEAKRQGLPEAWAYAIMREESAFEPRVTSPAKAFGLMQLIVPTAKKMAEPLGLPWDEESLKRPEVNIALGCRYLAYLRGQFSDSPLLAIPGYNAGSGAPKKWLGERPTDDFDRWVERIPYDETKTYTKRVITSIAAYEFLYAREQPSEARSTPLAASPSAKAAAAP
jgi:soluble lytic murein transglycosylase